MAGRPALLLLDEPMAGLSAAERSLMLRHLDRLDPRHRRADDRARHGRGVRVCRDRHRPRPGPRPVRRNEETRSARTPPCSGSTSAYRKHDAPDDHAAAGRRAHLLRRQPRAAGRVVRRARRAASTAVLGRNGVGKTTLCRIVVGFTPARAGRVVFDGVDITRMPSHRIHGMHLGLVPQGRRVFPSLTVYEHLAIAGRRRRPAWHVGSSSCFRVSRSGAITAATS